MDKPDRKTSDASPEAYEATGHRALGHIRSLDGLRALAVALTTAVHLYPTVVPGGTYGVDMFFVLSGFLITSILIDAHQRRVANLRRFWTRRIRRLVPAVTALTAVFAITYLGAADTMRDVAVALVSVGAIVTYLFNWTGVAGHEVPYQIDHLWSLAVEEQFYILWPAALYVLLPRLTRRRVIQLTIAGAVLSAGARAIFYLSTKQADAAYLATPFRADGLLFGCLIGELWTWRIGESWFRRLAAARAAYVVPLVVILTLAATSGISAGLFTSERFDREVLFVGGILVVGVASAVLLSALIAREGFGGRSPLAERVLSTRVLREIGVRSYSIYLWQNFMMWALDSRFHGTPLWLPVNIVATLAAAEVSYRFVERRFLTPTAHVPVPRLA